MTKGHFGIKGMYGIKHDVVRRYRKLTNSRVVFLAAFASYNEVICLTITI